MSTESVLIPADEPASGRGSSTEPRYSLLLSTDPELIEAAQRLRYDVFSHELGFTMTGPQADVDRFDEHCDHLVVRENKRHADTRYLRRLRSMSTAVQATGRVA